MIKLDKINPNFRKEYWKVGRCFSRKRKKTVRQTNIPFLESVEIATGPPPKGAILKDSKKLTK